MSHPTQESLTPKQQALHDLEEARASLAFHAAHAAEEWSPKAIITRSIHKHRAAWISAAAIAGLAVVKIVWSSAHPHPYARHEGEGGGGRRGLAALLLSPLIALARKSLMSYGSQWLQTYLHQKISPNAPDSEAV
ncbi:hypothetical protein [Prosthecobacter sp.]|uniref:hypothetical protein n=1 Tax=Prosthecobacter sp. TaxID=1965333 RepID=UPI0037836455